MFCVGKAHETRAFCDYLASATVVSEQHAYKICTALPALALGDYQMCLIAVLFANICYIAFHLHADC